MAAANRPPTVAPAGNLTDQRRNIVRTWSTQVASGTDTVTESAQNAAWALGKLGAEHNIAQHGRARLGGIRASSGSTRGELIHGEAHDVGGALQIHPAHVQVRDGLQVHGRQRALGVRIDVQAA